MLSTGVGRGRADVIPVCRQRVNLGRAHAGQTVAVASVAE